MWIWWDTVQSITKGAGVSRRKPAVGAALPHRGPPPPGPPPPRPAPTSAAPTRALPTRPAPTRARHHLGPPPPGPAPTSAEDPRLPALGLYLWGCPARRPLPSPRGAPCARGDAMMDLRRLSGPTAGPPSGTAEVAWTRPPSGRPGPADRPTRPFEWRVQLSLLASSP